MSTDELAPGVILLAQRGDRPARAALLQRYAPVLHGLVRRALVTGDPEEQTQALLQRVLERLPRFDPAGPAKLTTWVFTVAHHFLIDQRRRAHLAVVPLTEASAVRDEQADPHAAAWRGELRTALEAAIAQLPDEQRRVFVLVHLYEHSVDEAAKAEGIPVGTVKSRLFRARATLALRLSDELEGGPHDARAR